MSRRRSFGGLLASSGLVALLAASAMACGGSSAGGAGGDGAGLGEDGSGGAGGSGDGAGSNGSGNGSSGSSGTGTSGALPTGDCVVEQDITRSATWSPAACPDGYLVKFSLEVRGAGVELKMAPGTRIRLEASSFVTVEDGAAIVAEGTADQKVTFDGTGGAPVSWPGLRITSGNPANRLSHAIVRHAGNKADRSGAVVVAEGGSLALADTEIVDNDRYGLVVVGEGRLTSIDRVTIRRNQGGAGYVGVPHVAYLAGTGNVFEDNGSGNAMVVEASALYKVAKDTTWPSLAPAVYRIAGQTGVGGGIVKVEQHLTIEAGAILEMNSGSGFLMAGGTSGLRAVGTADKKIVFRGSAGGTWAGITFGESTWPDNRLEHVEVHSATTAPSWGYYGTGNPAPRKAGVLLGYNFATQVHVAIKDFLVTGPNNAPADVAVKGASVLAQEGGVVGTGAGGALEIEAL